jgi:calcineurin-like phosphoesterase family protein
MNKHIPYKYKLHYLLRNLSVNDYEIAMKHLPKMCKITTHTFKRWIYTKNDEMLDIPGTAILKLSEFFEVDPTDMYELSPIIKKELK